MQTKCVQDRIDFLESLILYYKKDNYNMIHPSEKVEEPNISKRNYNKLKKLYSLDARKRKFPEYPKSGKLTLALQVLFEEYKINPYN